MRVRVTRRVKFNPNGYGYGWPLPDGYIPVAIPTRGAGFAMQATSWAVPQMRCGPVAIYGGDWGNKQPHSLSDRTRGAACGCHWATGLLLQRPGLLLTCKEQRRLVVDLEPSANGNALPPLIRLPLSFLSFLPEKRKEKSRQGKGRGLSV